MASPASGAKSPIAIFATTRLTPPPPPLILISGLRRYLQSRAASSASLVSSSQLIRRPARGLLSPTIASRRTQVATASCARTITSSTRLKPRMRARILSARRRSSIAWIATPIWIKQSPTWTIAEQFNIPLSHHSSASNARTAIIRISNLALACLARTIARLAGSLH